MQACLFFVYSTSCVGNPSGGGVKNTSQFVRNKSTLYKRSARVMSRIDTCTLQICRLRINFWDREGTCKLAGWKTCCRMQLVEVQTFCNTVPCGIARSPGSVLRGSLMPPKFSPMSHQGCQIRLGPHHAPVGTTAVAKQIDWSEQAKRRGGDQGASPTIVSMNCSSCCSVIV
jgi:hypothetical protein